MWSNRTVQLILWILGVLVLGYILWNVRSIISYFFIAAIIAFVARPTMRLLGKVKIKNWVMPNWLKAAIVLITFVLILVGAVNLIIPTVVHQADIISKIDTDNLINKIQPQIQAATGWMEKANINEAEVQKSLEEEVSNLFNIGNIGSYIKGIIGGLTDSLIAVFSILFISFFLIKDGNIVDNVVDSLTPNNYLDKIKTIFNDAKNLLSRYFIGVIIQISIVMLVITIGLTILGVNNALLIGLIAGIFNIIPYVGPLIGGAVGVSLAITSQLEIDPTMDILSFGLPSYCWFLETHLQTNLQIYRFGHLRLNQKLEPKLLTVFFSSVQCLFSIIRSFLGAIYF